MKIKVKVIPGSKKEKIEEKEGFLKVYLNQPPQDNRANKRLIKILAKHFGVKKYTIDIIKGFNSRCKIIQIGESS